MFLKELILSLLLQHTPVGNTVFSVERMPECGTDPKAPTCEIVPVCQPATAPMCRAPWWSPSHGAWVRYETREGAGQRLEVVAAAVAETAKRLYCLDDSGRRIHGCKPVRWGWDGRRNTGTFREFVLTGIAAIIMESGAREDVEMGRGRYKKPVDGGQGRGPGNEACLFQILPSAVYRFSDLTAAEQIKASNSPKVREEMLQRLLGDSPEALERCSAIGFKMLAISRNVCDVRRAQADRQLGIKAPANPNSYWWAFGMYSFYGLGPKGGCYADNHGKTLARVRLLQMLLKTAPDITWPEPRIADAVEPK